MSFGLCLGSIGVGIGCGKTKSEQSVNITNTAVASAYYKSAFSCTRKTNAQNQVRAGMCSCNAAGINPADCAKYKLQAQAMQAQVCAENSDLDGPLRLCLCKLGGGGCNIGVDQATNITDQMACTNASKVENNLKNNFNNDLLSSLKSNNSDIGGLFDNNDQIVAANLATKIRQSIGTDIIQRISSEVLAGNSTVAECGGVNVGITQYSHMQSILKALTSNQVIANAMNDLENHVKASLDRKNSGFLGWLSSTAGIIVIIIIIAAVIVGVVLFIRYRNGQSPFEKSGSR